MPAYDYDCAACGRRFEVIHGVHAERPTACPLCGKGPVRKAISAPAVHYRGLGLGQEGASRDPDRRDRQGDGRRVHGGGRLEARHDLERQLGGRLGQLGRPGAESRRERRGQQDRLSPMVAASDWITLAEASDILAAANIQFTAATIGGWARAGRLQTIKLGGRRFVRRGEVRALVAAPRRVRAEDVQPVLFEDLGS